MKILNYLKQSVQSLYLSLKRFPITLGISTTLAIVLIIMVQNNDSFSEATIEKLWRVSLTIALGIPLSLCTKLLIERGIFKSSILKGVLYLVEAAALVLYYNFLLKEFELVSITRYIGISICLYVAFVLIPYFYKRVGTELYVLRLMVRFFITAVFSIVLFLGMAAILFTIDQLLGVNVNEKPYLDVLIVIASIFAPCYFLAGVPAFKDNFGTDDYPTIFKVLLLYIVMPLSAAYTSILHIYFIKILVTRQWPEGMVAHLVLWYSVICVALLFLITPLKDSNKWVKTYSSLFQKLIIPLLILMFVSIGIRVNAYGITEARYFVIVLGLWVLGNLIYLNIAREKRNIILLISLSLIAVLSVAGPWSSYSVSKLSQNLRFEKILTKNHMLQNDKIVKAKTDVSDTDRDEINQILIYFDENHSLKDVRYLSSGFRISTFEKILGFPLPDYYSRGGFNKDKEYFNYAIDMTKEYIDISGYDYLTIVEGDNNFHKASPSTNLSIEYISDKNEMVINYKGEEVYKKSVFEFVEKVHKLGPEQKNKGIDIKSMTFKDENDKVRLKYIFSNMDGYRDSSNGKIKVSSVRFSLFVAIK